MLDYFIEEDEFLEEFGYLLGNIVQQEKNPEVERLAGMVISKIAKRSKKLKPLVLKPTMEPLLAQKSKRVYIPIFDKKQRGRAKAVGEHLAEKGYKVPGVERIARRAWTSMRFASSSRRIRCRDSAFVKPVTLNSGSAAKNSSDLRNRRRY